MKSVLTKSRLSLFNSGKFLWTFRDAYRFSMFFRRQLCVRSRVERAEREASGASPCVTVAQVELRADSMVSTSPCSESTLSSSFFSLAGASVQLRLGSRYVEVKRHTYEIREKAAPPVEVSIVHEGHRWEFHRQGVLHMQLCPAC